MIPDEPYVPTGSAPVSLSLAEANAIVLVLDGQGTVIYLNPFGLEFFGYQAEEIVGRHAVGTIVPPKDRSGSDLAVMIDDLLHSPEDYARQINENRRKNGERVWVVWANRAFRDPDGSIVRILSVGNDITDRKAFESFLEDARVRLTATIQRQNRRLQNTNQKLKDQIAERKRTQQQLKESRDRYRLLSQAPTEGILFHNSGIIIDVNDAFAELVECPRDQLIGMDVIRHFVAPEDRDRVRRRVQNNDQRGYEITGCSTTGHTFPAELRASPGEIAGQPCRVVTVRDISWRKKTERKLIQSQKMEAVGTLAGGIAHDFNNMLAGIQGNIEIIRHQLSSGSPHRHRLDTISQIVERGAKLTGQLLGYARGGQTDVREVDLNALIADTLDMFGRTQRQIVIQTRTSPDTPMVRGDPTQIEQVLLNLMINAVHAMPKGGHLFVETTAVFLSEGESPVYEVIPGRYAMLSVRDNGTGMDRQTQKQIFDPFFTTKERGQGTGLGLASTYGIVKNHKGYVEVYSEPGVGSQFNILLPASASQSPSPAAPDSEVLMGIETIMLVDDDPDFLDVGREMLKMLGYTVISATNSEETLRRFAAHSGAIDLLIIDMIMPGPPVDETIRGLRAIDASIPVLLSSGYSQDAEPVRQPLKICDGFIQKPFRLVSLSQKIRAMLRTSKR